MNVFWNREKCEEAEVAEEMLWADGSPPFPIPCAAGWEEVEESEVKG